MQAHTDSSHLHRHGVYYPCLYEIKAKHNWLDGPRHVLHQLQLLQLQDSTVQELVKPYVQSSCWYSHSEMILQTMISSEDPEERRFAVETMTNIRGKRHQGQHSSPLQATSGP